MSYEKYTVWSNKNLDLKDWIDDLKYEYPDASEEELTELMWETNNMYLEDERVNLDINVSSPILVIADLGLWDGRKSGYKEIPSGNIKDCLFSECEYVEWFVEDDEFKCEESHHDGTNYLTYRKYKETASEKEREALKEKIYDGTATQEDIDKVTEKIGRTVMEVYWYQENVGLILD